MKNAKEKTISIVLVAPEIPGNTGSIGRTALALNYRLILIKPYGFDIDEKSVRRAGLDYWKNVDLVEYDSFEDFLESENPTPEQLHFFSRFSNKNYFQNTYRKNDYLIFGSETKGLPECIWEKFPERFFKVPILSDKVRSLNLACCCSIVGYESFRQISTF